MGPLTSRNAPRRSPTSRTARQLMPTPSAKVKHVQEGANEAGGGQRSAVIPTVKIIKETAKHSQITFLFKAYMVKICCKVQDKISQSKKIGQLNERDQLGLCFIPKQHGQLKEFR